MLATVWPLIDPALFTSVVDMVEDIMQASLPKFVDAVRISDLGLGSNPPRIVAMRGLPDHTTDKEYPREEWIFRAKPGDSQVGEAGAGSGAAQGGRAKDRNKGSNATDKIDGEAERERKVQRAKDAKKTDGQTNMNQVDKTDDELDQSGDYVNYEISLAYQARPGKSTGARAGNLHLMIEFFLGAVGHLLMRFDEDSTDVHCVVRHVPYPNPGT